MLYQRSTNERIVHGNAAGSGLPAEPAVWSSWKVKRLKRHSVHTFIQCFDGITWRGFQEVQARAKWRQNKFIKFFFVFSMWRTRSQNVTHTHTHTHAHALGQGQSSLAPETNGNNEMTHSSNLATVGDFFKENFIENLNRIFFYKGSQDWPCKWFEIQGNPLLVELDLSVWWRHVTVKTKKEASRDTNTARFLGDVTSHDRSWNILFANWKNWKKFWVNWTRFAALGSVRRQ